jgi:hypothetical protein
MYGLIEFEETEEGFSVAEASTVMTVLEEAGFKIQFADDIVELMELAGGELTNQDEYEAYIEARDTNKKRYEKMRKDLHGDYIGLDGPNEKFAAKARDKVKIDALIDIAEALNLMSGIAR